MVRELAAEQGEMETWDVVLGTERKKEKTTNQECPFHQSIRLEPHTHISFVSGGTRQASMRTPQLWSSKPTIRLITTGILR